MTANSSKSKSLEISVGVCLLLVLSVGSVFWILASLRISEARQIVKEAEALMRSSPEWYLRGFPKTQAEIKETRKMQQEAAEISKKVGVLRAKAEAIEPLIFEQRYMAKVLFWFGCHVGLAIVAIWPIGLCVRGLFRGNLDEPMLILLCMVSGGLLWQAYVAYTTLTDGRPNDRLFESLIGIVWGLVAGLGIGCVLAIGVWYFKRKRNPMPQR